MPLQLEWVTNNHNLDTMMVIRLMHNLSQIIHITKLGSTMLTLLTRVINLLKVMVNKAQLVTLLLTMHIKQRLLLVRMQIRELSKMLAASHWLTKLLTNVLMITSWLRRKLHKKATSLRYLRSTTRRITSCTEFLTNMVQECT